MPKFKSNENWEVLEGDITAEDIEKKIPKSVRRYGDAGDLTAEMRAELEAEMKAISPPIISIATCNVCQHEYRQFIEAMLVKGRAYKAIAQSVPLPEGSSVDSFRRSISGHYKNHMALEDAAMRAILEEEADLAGQNYEEGVRGAITARGILQVALQKGFEDIQNGISAVEFRDMVQAIKLLREMDDQTHDTQLESYKVQVAIFTEAIRDVLGQREDGEEIMKEIAERIRYLRERDNFDAEVESTLGGPRRVGIPETVEAEVIDG